MSFVKQKVHGIARPPDWLKWAWLTLCLPGWVLEGAMAIVAPLAHVAGLLVALLWLFVAGSGIFHYRSQLISRDSLLFFSMPFSIGYFLAFSPYSTPTGANFGGLLATLGANLLYLLVAPFFMPKARGTAIVAALAHGSLLLLLLIFLIMMRDP